MDLIELFFFAFMLVVAALFATGLVLLLFKHGQAPIECKVRLLPSTCFTLAAVLAAVALIGLIVATRASYVGDWGEGIAFYTAIGTLAGGAFGALGSLFGVEVVPRWQWLGQLVSSTGAFLTGVGIAFMFLNGLAGF